VRRHHRPAGRGPGHPPLHLSTHSLFWSVVYSSSSIMADVKDPKIAEGELVHAYSAPGAHDSLRKGPKQQRRAHLAPAGLRGGFLRRQARLHIRGGVVEAVSEWLTSSPTSPTPSRSQTPARATSPSSPQSSSHNGHHSATSASSTPMTTTRFGRSSAWSSGSARKSR